MLNFVFNGADDPVGLDLGLGALRSAPLDSFKIAGVLRVGVGALALGAGAGTLALGAGLGLGLGATLAAVRLVLPCCLFK